MLTSPDHLPGEVQGKCRRTGLDWATLLKRVLALEVLLCASCGGQRRVIAEIPEGPVARAILEHLGMPTTAPKPRQGGLFQTGPPEANEPDAFVDPPWQDNLDRRIPDSDPFA